MIVHSEFLPYNDCKEKNIRLILNPLLYNLRSNSRLEYGPLILKYNLKKGNLDFHSNLSLRRISLIEEVNSVKSSNKNAIQK